MLGPRCRGSPVGRLRGGEDLPGPPPHGYHHPAYLRPPRPAGLHSPTCSHGDQRGPSTQRVQYMKRNCWRPDVTCTHTSTHTNTTSSFLSGILQPEAEIRRESSCYFISVDFLISSSVFYLIPSLFVLLDKCDQHTSSFFLRFPPSLESFVLFFS